MANKMSIILSFSFIFLIFSLAIDLIKVQLLYTEMDSVSLTATYLISKNGDIDKAKRFVEKEHFEFRCDTTQKLQLGEVCEFYIFKVYDPIIMSNGEMNLEIKRSAIVGYYQ